MLGGKAMFFAAVQASRMPMCLADARQPDLPLVFVNDAFLTLSGYAEHEVIGRNCRFLQGNDTDRAEVARLREAIARREDTAVELVNYRRDGAMFWNALYVSPVYDRSGALVYFFASQLDITRRKQAEGMLQQSQRMEALGSLASGMAHEFNNLMTIVVGSAQQAAKRAVDDRQRKQLARIDWAGRQAGWLTQQMLSFTRRQFHQPQHGDLGQIVAGFGRLLARLGGSAVTLALELAPDALPVVIDASQLELALINLVRNAVDAMPGGGRLAIRTRADSSGGRRWAVLVVADTGHGMPDDVLRHAADPFFTTKRPGSHQDRSAGLGLSMVSGFVQQSGGQMTLDSQPGAGTRVTMRLPLADDHGGS